MSCVSDLQRVVVLGHPGQTRASEMGKKESFISTGSDDRFSGPGREKRMKKRSFVVLGWMATMGMQPIYGRLGK